MLLIERNQAIPLFTAILAALVGSCAAAAKKKRRR